MEAAIEFREQSLKVECEAGPGVSIRQVGKSCVEFSRERWRGSALRYRLIDYLK